MNYLFISPRSSPGFLTHLFDYPSLFNRFTGTLDQQRTQTHILSLCLIPKPKIFFLVSIVTEGSVFQLHITQSNIGISWEFNIRIPISKEPASNSITAFKGAGFKVAYRSKEGFLQAFRVLQIQICNWQRQYTELDHSVAWLRYYTASQKVAGSIPDEVIELFYCPKLSSRTRALGSTQSLRDMGTRKLSGGERAAGT